MASSIRLLSFSLLLFIFRAAAAAPAYAPLLAPSPAKAAAYSPPSPPPDIPRDSPSPSPSADLSGVGREDLPSSTAGESRGGINAGGKAGISIGIIAAAAVVVGGAAVYRKRRQNIRRTRHAFGGSISMV
ncbi:hypothetical protein M569_07126 [Genlisea aurea]|uniref:Uncharacterized protein n=1 Tax=Genlisea aurea TaxID=192259 RepID=S8CS10_9LAMI|nr:hypothetical protein M569_07126 [Genlisea aurea]